MNFFNNYSKNISYVYYRTLNSKVTIFTIILLMILFIILYYNSYLNYIKPKLSEHKLNKEFIDNDDTGGRISIMFFHTEWCPYCKSSLPEWLKFKFYIETNYYPIK